MALDTKAKRMSMLALASPLAWGHHFEVDGAVDADDRAHLLHLYGGIAFADVAPTLNIRIKIGSRTLVTTGTITPPSGATNKPWRMDCLFVVRSTGLAGSVLPTGEWNNGQTSGITGSALAATLDTTVANPIQVTAKWGTASASNTITVHNLLDEMSG